MIKLYAMLKVGVTGGIGSGKSVLCNILKLMGVDCFNADIEAKRVMVTCSELISDIKALLGPEAYIEHPKDNFTLNRGFVAEAIFNNRELLEELNSLVHPKVREAFSEWCVVREKRGDSYILFEAAILIESGLYRSLDRVVMVTAPEDIRINRAVARDGATRASIESRIKQQISDKDREGYCHYKVCSDESVLFTPQVVKLHKEILEWQGDMQNG